MSISNFRVRQGRLSTAIENNPTANERSANGRQRREHERAGEEMRGLVAADLLTMALAGAAQSLIGREQHGGHHQQRGDARADGPLDQLLAVPMQAS